MSRKRSSGYPRVQDFQSTWMEAKTGELFNPPGLTNFLGSLQAASCVMGIQHLTFPPYSQGDIQLGVLTINGTCIQTSGKPVKYRWRPDRLERSIRVDGFDLSTVTVMGVGAQTVVVELEVKNGRSTRRKVDLRIRTGGGAIHSVDGWKTPYSPKEGPAISVTPWEGAPPPESLTQNSTRRLARNEGIHYSSVTSVANSIQAGFPTPTGIDRSWLDYSFTLGAGQTKKIYYFVGLGQDAGPIKRQLATWRKAPAAAIAAAEADWNEEIRAIFTPGNARYSGHLPYLHTTNSDLRRIYLNTIISIVYLKRDHPDSAYGKTYATIMPRYWVVTSFINDWSMSAYLLAMLDPVVLRTTIEMWLARDIYSHFGTDYVSGTNSGNWYSCNDYAMIRLITAYVRVTGEREWLGTIIDGKSILEHACYMAEHYKELDAGHGLADYGDRNSLLEAVGAYTHEVASLSAANVWMLREMAEFLDHIGSDHKANAYRKMADDLVPHIQKLYVSGTGYWACRQPDGELIPIRHAWDFVHTMNFIHSDLPRAQKAEMIRFFKNELMTPSWMAALSSLDEDIGFSLRLDHEWNGSWPGWVALATSALLRAGRADLLKSWLPGLARSTNQGPFSQAHFVEEYADPFDGGARKGPTEWPYINDWAVVCVGGFFETILYDMFGINHPIDGELKAYPDMTLFDDKAWLDNVPHHGSLYRIGPRID